MQTFIKKAIFICQLLFFLNIQAFSQENVFLRDKLTRYIEYFNNVDNERYPQLIQNREALDFLSDNIPLFDCPDKTLEEIYYFRWWTFRKHIKRTPRGYIITEFLPKVPWAGKFNGISCPLGHHFYEGRWLKDKNILKDYLRYWLIGEGKSTLRNYSSWIGDGWMSFVEVNGKKDVNEELLKSLKDNYFEWKASNYVEDIGLFWQEDSRDGMEVSAAGQVINNGLMSHSYKGFRPTINSYLYRDLQVISEMSGWVGDMKAHDQFREESERIRKLILEKLWDDSLHFFGSIPMGSESKAVIPVRELIGYTPWYFNLPPDSIKYSIAWDDLLESDGFRGSYGITTCEQRSPFFQVNYFGHNCQWNGPVWLFATSQVLTSLANLLDNYDQDIINVNDYYTLLVQYAKSQYRYLENGRMIPWIDEDLDPFTGEWIARNIIMNSDDNLFSRGKEREERGRDYNHSTFCDLIISGLVGIRPSLENYLTIRPLIPQGSWKYFCLDNVYYHGKKLTILYDIDGTRYNKGKGFKIWSDDELIYSSKKIEGVRIKL